MNRTNRDAVPALPQTGLSQAAPCLRDWWGIWLGLALLTSLLLYDFATLLWMQGEKLDNGLILLIALGLMVQQRQQFRCLERPARPMLSSLLLLFGLLLFVVGRSQTILFFEAFSVWVILLACLHLVGGGGLLRSVWFPLLLLIFVMPLPGVFVNAFTGEMKQYVSLAVEMLLYGLGYPIARDGVILSVGPYQLLVADACSGINSIFSLTAIGLVYLYLTPKPGFGRNAILLVSILPIAILANVIRVLVLVLITYHFGYAAGQGFAHTTAHILLFIAAVALLIGIDSTLGLIASRRRSAG